MVLAREEYSRWTIDGQGSIDNLVLGTVKIPELGDEDVLVKIHAVSLNFRDLVLVKGQKGLKTPPSVVACSDGAGIITAIGRHVQSFSLGEKVLTHLTTHLEDGAFPSYEDIFAGLGHGADGTLGEYAVLHQSAVVRMPTGLSYREASTLTCSGLTAWNAVFGGGRRVSKGDIVLVQGTGGVSVAALQFAKGAGATVIATTSSASKAERLAALGADHVLNYREDPTWGTTARSLTPGNRGVDLVVDVGGVSTLTQSLAAARIDGVIALTGLLGDAPPEGETLPGLMDCLWKVCTVRGVLLGTKAQMREMCEKVEEWKIKPVVDDKVFALREAREALRYLEAQQHFSKVVIDVIKERQTADYSGARV